MALNQFCGALAIITYSANIFTESGSDLSPNVSSIIVALIQLTGTVVSFILVDNLGRKILLLISTIGTTAGLFSMGIFSFLQHSGHDLSELGSLPILSLSFTILFSSFGILPLPYVILAEVLPQKVSINLSFLQNGTSFRSLLPSVTRFVTLAVQSAY